VTAETRVVPTELRLHRQSRTLEVAFDDGSRFALPAEYLRVYSPSAQVRGHQGLGATLQVGKRDVAITDLRQVGHYAVKIFFDDGHDSGLFTWDYLHTLGTEQASRWADYLARLEKAGASRDPAA